MQGSFENVHIGLYMRKSISRVGFYLFDLLDNNLYSTLVAQTVKNVPLRQETQVRSLGRNDSLEKEMAAHISIAAWEIP